MEECLKGEVTEAQVLGWTEQEWRAFQFKQMVETNKRLSKLETQAAWRNVLISIPWTIVGGLIVYLAK
jgi:hypothetical protein